MEAQALQKKVSDQLQEAKAAVTRLEREMVALGQKQRRELEALVARVQSGAQLKAFTKKLKGGQQELKKRFDELQTRLMEALGVATHAEVAELNRELSRLNKKIDRLLKAKKNGKSADDPALS
jgi:chromosome segregation ATPase